MESEINGMSSAQNPDQKTSHMGEKGLNITSSTLLDSISDAAIITNREFVILSWNRAAENLYGWTADEAVGKPMTSLIPTEYGDTTQDEVLDILAAQGRWQGEVIQRCKDGRQIWVMSSVNWLTDDVERVVGAIALNRDITGRYHHQDRLRQSEIFLNALLNAPLETVALIDPEGTILTINEQGAQVFGVGADELIGQNIYSFLPPELAQARKALINQVLETGEPAYFEDRRAQHHYVTSVKSVVDEHTGQLIGAAIFANDVTERRRFEEEAQRFRQAVEYSPSMVYLTDGDGRIQYVNPKFSEVTGYTAEEAIGHLPRILDPGKISRDEYDERWRIIKSEHVWRGEFQNRRKNGESFWESASISTIIDSTGKITHLVLVLEDITERKQAEEAIKLSETRYRSLVQTQSDVIARIDLDGNLTFVNDSYCHAFGKPCDELLGTPFTPYILPEDLPVTLNSLEEIKVPPYRKQVETRHQTPLGIRWFSWNRSAVRDDEDNIIEFQEVGRDITESKQAEEALRENEQRYWQLIENLHSGVVVHAPDTSIILHNERAAELLGLSEDRMLGRTANDGVWNFVRADGSVMPTEEYPVNRVLKSQQVLVNLEIGFNRPGTTERVWGLVNAFPVFDEHRHIQHVVVTFMDITERKKASDELQRLSEFHEALVQGLAEGVIVNGADGTIEFVNPAGAALLGYVPDEIIGRRIAEFVPTDQQALLASVEERRTHGLSGRYELELKHREGRHLNVLVGDTPRFEADRFAGSISVFTEITSMVQSQIAVRESQEFFQSTLNALSAHIAILDETSTIIAVNEAWRRFADANGMRDPTYGVGTNYLAFCDSAKGPDSIEASVVAAGIRNLLKRNGNGFHLEYPCHGPDENRWFSMRLDSFRIGDARRIVIAHYDITERKLAEENERRQRMIASALADVASTINQAVDVDEILEHIIGKVKHIVPHSGANIMLVDVEKDEAQIVRYCQCYAKNNLPEPLLGEVVTLSNMPKLKAFIDKAQPFVVSDVATSPDWRVTPTTEWIRSYAGAPIRLNDKVIGLINVNSDIPGTFTRVDAYQLQVLADQAAIAIRNVQLYKELENYSEFLQQAVAERTEQLEHSTEHIESILNSSIDAIVLVQHRSGMIQQANPTFDEWFGNPSGDVYGRHLSELIMPEQVDHVLETLNLVFDSHQPQRIEIEAQREDDTTFDADMAIFPVLQHDGEVISVVCSMRDISERKQAEQTLQQTLEREMEVSNMRMRFLSMASHDLRNPLAVIQSSVEMLANYHDRLSEERKEAKFRQIQAGISHMVELLDDVLTIGRAEAGRLTFNPETVELDAFCHNLITEIRASIGTNHSFDFIHPGGRMVRRMDPKLLRHILYNLLSNAVKYSPAESTVTFELDTEADQIVFRIRDEGIGIPEADLPRLFEPFHRASNVGVISGTGLGLAIVKQSTELHGGKVSYDTYEGQGSTFTVKLPDLRIEETV